MIPNAQRFGSATEVTYQCDECKTGDGRATCRNGEGSHEGSCESQYTHRIFVIQTRLAMSASKPSHASYLQCDSI